jgi:hypothetical protein
VQRNTDALWSWRTDRPRRAVVEIRETSHPDGDWIDLAHGVQVQLVPPEGGVSVFRPGDYWLVPARTALGDVVWPSMPGPDGQPVPQPRSPLGVEHRYRYAPLAWVSVDAAGAVTVNARYVRTVAPLAECP